MARGILEMRHVPSTHREWEQFLRDINALIKVSTPPPGLIIEIALGSVPLAALVNVATARFLGRVTAGTGVVELLTAAQVAGAIQSSIDHGTLIGLGDDDHAQYVLRSILTTNGDIYTRAAGVIARLGVGAATQLLGVTAGLPAWQAQTYVDHGSIAGLTDDDHPLYALDADLASGRYTPTLTNVANLDGSTAFKCQWLRVGTTVNVSGRVSVNPTLAATSTQLGISLPIASNFGAVEDCAGTAFATGIAGQGAGIIADAANDRAQMQWVASDVTDQPMQFCFTYDVI